MKLQWVQLEHIIVLVCDQSRAGAVPVVSVQGCALDGSIITATRVGPDPVEGDILRGGDRCKPTDIRILC